VKGDRGQQRLQTARRQVDDQPSDLAGAQHHQFRGDGLDMSVHRELGPPAQLAEATLREAAEIEPQPGVFLALGHFDNSDNHTTVIFHCYSIDSRSKFVDRQ
jgi:hypothetical protein